MIYKCFWCNRNVTQFNIKITLVIWKGGNAKAIYKNFSNKSNTMLFRVIQVPVYKFWIEVSLTLTAAAGNPCDNFLVQCGNPFISSEPVQADKGNSNIYRRQTIYFIYHLTTSTTLCNALAQG